MASNQSRESCKNIENRKNKKRKKNTEDCEDKFQAMILNTTERKFSTNKRKNEDSPQSDKKKFRVSNKKFVKNKNVKSEQIQEKTDYFEKILQTLKSGLSDDSKDLFVINALEESLDHEVELSSISSSSHCIELLLSMCKEPNTFVQFMTAFSQQKETVCTNANASHITELLLHYAVQNIKNWSSVMESEEESKEKEQMSFHISWITEFGDFLSEHFFDFLTNPYSSHVACSIIKALGGEMTADSEFKSKRALNHKKEFSTEYIDEAEEFFFAPVTLEKIPKCFKEKLKQISRTVRQTKNISNYVSESFCATVFEALVLVLEKRLPKQRGKFMTEFTAELFSEKNDEGVPHALLHKNCSYLVEKLFQAADEQFQTVLWMEFLSSSIYCLAVHRIGNYLIQRLFDVVKETTLLLQMTEKLVELFDKVLEAENYGIFISMAAACIRLKAHQALFMKSLMQCLRCQEPEDRQLKVVPLLLCFKKFEEYDSNIYVCLQGSLLIQKLLEFQKPIKLVKSLLNLKPEEISYLACHIQGCHVLNAFFRSSSVGEKNKDKFIQCVQPALLDLACDRNGSLTLSRLWILLTLKQKSAVIDTLLRNEEKLKSNKNGNIIFNKFKIFHYKHKHDQWKEMQLSFVKKSSNCK